jgi:hypothetical protein
MEQLMSSPKFTTKPRLTKKTIMMILIFHNQWQLKSRGRAPRHRWSIQAVCWSPLSLFLTKYWAPRPRRLCSTASSQCSWCQCTVLGNAPPASSPYNLVKISSNFRVFKKRASLKLIWWITGQRLKSILWKTPRSSQSVTSVWISQCLFPIHQLLTTLLQSQT